METVTRAPHPLDGLFAYVDLERSHSFHQGRVALGLERMRALLAALPERPWPGLSVHVAGSEGKTTVTEMVAAGLRAHGLRVGTFTSPHLRDTRERICVDGAWVADELLEQAVERVVRAAAEIRPTWFEGLSAVARWVFAEVGVDAAVWETGLGGRLDATRLMRADICALTSVSLEHAAILGDTLTAIAREKAGILRPGVPVVLGPDVAHQAQAEVRLRAAALRCPLSMVTEPGAGPLGAGRAVAGAVLAALRETGRLSGDSGAEREALLACRVPGRFQQVGRTLFDGAHTVAAVRRLLSLLEGEQPACVVFGVTSGRDARAMLEPLSRAAGQVVLTRAPRPRGVDPAELAQLVPGCESVEEPTAALDCARDLAGPDGLVLVTGSLHLVGALLPDGA